MRDGLNLDGILMVVQGEDDLFGVLEVLDRGVGGEEMVPNKEQKPQDGTKLDCPAVACTLGVLA